MSGVKGENSLKLPGTGQPERSVTINRQACARQRSCSRRYKLSSSIGGRRAGGNRNPAGRPHSNLTRPTSRDTREVYCAGLTRSSWADQQLLSSTLLDPFRLKLSNTHFLPTAQQGL